MNASYDNKKVVFRRILSVILLLFFGAFVFFAPRLFKDRLTNESYREYFIQMAEPTSAIVKVWHIVSFKPYSGSLGSWLSDRARSLSGRYVNVYFEVVSMSAEDAFEELGRGEYPDVISFGDNGFDKSLLKGFDHGGDRVSFVPYCASGYLMAYDPGRTVGLTTNEIAEASGSVSEFKKGNAVSVICDIRGIGDLFRAQLAGRCPYFEAEPIDGQPILKQYLGVYEGISEEKIKYALEFIDFITEKSSQDDIARIGLLPVSDEAEPVFDNEWLNKLYIVFKKGT